VVNSAEAILDVWDNAPYERQRRIFDSLSEGGRFVLVNDHDPQPLYSQFLHTTENRFLWEYLEQGPDVWRIRIGKK